ncbi:hypothetical protein ACVILI_005369 [Mesorhizobium sp. USDA 4775]|uniref:hypothetical protein n=1 Tax=Mesorhizobium jarvisii TaxID=1777867 RepID=UPI00049A7D83|nr:hypothetical protein [Mesorhizobium jarvisii]AID31593.1 hypothetical protein MCHK_3790 [Mesorhizobium huakuii 7653R]MCH4558984.1 hypothetical protein [Mesorhizobium jarvisii]
MSTQLVKDQIKAFLKTDTPEVLCIRGNWGTGKTYNWQTTVKALRKDPKAVALKEYAYVSLFGVSSITQIKAGILQNTVVRDKIGDLITSETVSEVVSRGEKGLKTSILKVFSLGGSGIFDAALSALSLLSTNQIICFDDLERKGAGISAGDILGFMSYLKEERRCKVVLLLNDEALKGADKDQFTSYLEKVVDINLRFAPTPAESAKIAMDGVAGADALKAMVSERSVKLGIDNVRVIRKIFRLVALIEPMLKDYQPGVLKSVVSSIVLFGWCHFQPELSPSTEYVKQRGLWETAAERQKKKEDPVAEKWSQLLRSYGYGHTDEFDLVLMEGVADGYFEQDKIDAHAAALHKREQASEARRELDVAWDKFHYSFRDSQDEVLGTMYGAFMKNAEFHNLGAVTALIDLFRELEGRERADKMFERFVETHEGIPGAFDTSSMLRFGHEIPEDMKERVVELNAGEAPKLTVDELFLKLERDGFHSKVADRLAEVPVDEYVRVLTSYVGEDLAKIRRGLTADLNVINPNEASIRIMERAGEALTIIAKESGFNARRARGWRLIERLEGPKVEQEEEDGVAAVAAERAPKPARPAPAKPASKRKPRGKAAE